MTDTHSTSSPAQSTGDPSAVSEPRKIPYEQATIIGGVNPTKSDLDSGFMFHDLLRTMFAGQRILMARLEDIEEHYGSPVVGPQDFGDINGRTVQMRLHELFGYMVRESAEAMQHLHSKPWKTKYKPTDREEFEEEMVDTFHFFIEMCITAGISADRLFELYFAKWETNHVRQDTGY